MSKRWQLVQAVLDLSREQDGSIRYAKIEAAEKIAALLLPEEPPSVSKPEPEKDCSRDA